MTVPSLDDNMGMAAAINSINNTINYTESVKEAYDKFIASLSDPLSVKDVSDAYNALITALKSYSNPTADSPFLAQYTKNITTTLKTFTDSIVFKCTDGPSAGHPLVWQANDSHGQGNQPVNFTDFMKCLNDGDTDSDTADQMRYEAGDNHCASYWNDLASGTDDFAKNTLVDTSGTTDKEKSDLSNAVNNF